MEVAVVEEKKKIFRARKTMKISDRQQLETLHSTLLTGTPPSSNSSSPPLAPLLNGTHKEDGHKRLDKEQNDISDSKSPHATSPVSLVSGGSPPPSLSLNLSPSPPSSKSPKVKEDTPPSPASPFHSLNFELKKMEEEAKKTSSPTASNDCSATASTEAEEGKENATEVTTEVAKMEKNEEKTTETEKEETHAIRKEPDMDSCKDSVKGPAPCSPVSPAVSEKSEKDHRMEPEYTEPMETDEDSMEVKAPEAPEATTGTEKKPVSPKGGSSGSSSPCPAPSSLMVPELDQEVKDEEEEEEEEKEEKEIKEDKDFKQDVKIGPTKEEKMEVDSVKVEMKKEKTEVAESSKSSRPSPTPPSDTGSSRPSSTPPSDTGVKERSSTSGLKRTLSEGDENDRQKVERDGKRHKVEGVELEAQLELKITAKAGSRIKLEKVVQQLVEERLRVLQLTVFDQNLQELKDRVEKMDCATKHQTTLTTLQTKIARLAKKFGEANQASENKKKQEALAAAVAAAKAAVTANTLPTQRQVRTSMEVKQTLVTPASTNATAFPAQPTPAQPTPASIATTTAMVQQAPILQLITSASNVASSLGTGITTQSPTGTHLLLKTASQGPPLLIQVPLSMTNGQPGTLVNIPVSTFSAVTSLNKAKCTTPTATFILKPAPSCTTSVASSSVPIPALQASHMSPAQISLARAVYQGGAGGINTPSAGVSVTTARIPAQTVSVAGAMSSASSPATSGPAATGSAAPGPPQGTSMTSKTDNQATGSSPTKTAVPGARPKGSVIDLTDDDDDVQVTGVKNAVAAPPSANQRPPPLISISNNAAAARSSPQINQSSVSNTQHTPNIPPLTVHHRPPQDSPLKSRPVTTTTPTRAPTLALPPLPVAPVPVGRLPPEAAQTSPPQQPQLKLVPSQTGIVLSWCVSEPDRTCATVDSYHLYAFHQDNTISNASQQYWKKIGEVKALPLPMACTLTQFQSGSTYHFAVRAKDIYGRFGSFCEPQCTNVISSSSG